MFAFLLFAVLGAIIVVFGVNNIIAPLVWFNKAEVAEENKTVFPQEYIRKRCVIRPLCRCFSEAMSVIIQVQIIIQL